MKEGEKAGHDKGPPTLVQRAKRRFAWERHKAATRLQQIEYELPWESRNVRRLRSLSAAHARRRVFVIGNGPSLSAQDLDRLQHEVTIASNGIFLMFPKTRFRPTYYTVEDPLVAEDRQEEIRALQGPLKLIPKDLRRFYPRNDDTIHVNFVRTYPKFPRFSLDGTSRFYWGGTVTFLNLQLAYHLGASEILLLGVDHNYLPPTSRDHVADTVITSQSGDRSHFDSAYFGPGYRWHDPKPERMEKAYREAKRIMDRQGVPIRNATRGGNLDVFPRVDFDRLFAEEA